MPSDRTPSSPAPAETESGLLVRDCLANRPGAWEEFLHRYSNLIYSTILKDGLPRTEQEDAYQAAIVAIYRQLGSLRDTARLVPWIVVISHRQAINRIRARRKETSLDDISAADLAKAEAALANSDGLPDVQVVALERAQQATETLSRLPERCRRLIQLLFYEDPAPDYSEIARQEGIPVGSIGPTRARCLEKARRIFEDRGWA